MSEARRELEQIIARLKVMSHVASGFKAGEGGGVSTDDAKGGRRPTGGIDRRDDNDRDDTLVKSADHYLARLANAKCEGDVLRILPDARKTLRSWTHSALPHGEDPPYDHPQWKKWVAESSKSNAEIARIYNLSREYVRKVRREYGEREAA